MIRIREYQKLNSTGSLLKHVPTDTIYSYDTPIYREFTLSSGRVLKVFNNTYYSTTTRKHQAQIGHLRGYADLIVHYCPFGEWDLNTALNNEIKMVQYNIETLSNKPRKLGKRQAERLEYFKDRLNTLQKLYAEV